MRTVDDEPFETSDPALPDFGYVGGLRDGVDLYDKAATARLLGEANR